MTRLPFAFPVTIFARPDSVSCAGNVPWPAAAAEGIPTIHEAIDPANRPLHLPCRRRHTECGMKASHGWIVPFLVLSNSVALCGANEDEDDSFSTQRQRMVDQDIARRGIDDEATLRAMRAVPRHRFVLPRYEDRAYGDRPLPIGHGQTISQPYIVAYMTAQLDTEPEDRVLEVGTGSGYQAAVLAEIVAAVYTIEIIEPLAERSRSLLTDELNYANISGRHGDGYFGWPEAAPFDAVVVTAASETIPPPLIEQLKDGGRMIIPVGPRFGAQHLVLVTKEGERIRTRTLLPVRFVPFTRAKS